MLKTPKIWTVSELTHDIKEVLENIFVDVLVEGEISNLRQPSSGHSYFSLKDAASSLKCVLFRQSAGRVKFALADGMKVTCGGRIGVYERDGQYQLYVDTAEPQGKGSLQLAFEQLKEKLAKEGLFEESRKKPLPFLPGVIGVVTSPTGAVIRDILHVLDRRFPGHHVIINPVRVQGDEAKVEVVAAIEDFNALGNVDVIILARGGGSLEDLWCFNEEAVARAIFNSKIPVISAIGHETDYTIADFVADRRAPTPSAAAEIVLPARSELYDKIESLTLALWRSLSDIVPQHMQRVDDLFHGLSRAVSQRMAREDIKIKGLIDRLESLSPLAILKRGYSITSLSGQNKALYSAGDLRKGDKIRTRLSRGEFVSEVLETF
ncbi:MAG TPA: exodeoxyribonuclease VII large subunit [Candidatus Omnitrophica bacterium]|nr:exodeoxyribonuclease VII large subunit [Candidatus Omnitrophota bacterium]